MGKKRLGIIILKGVKDTKNKSPRLAVVWRLMFFRSGLAFPKKFGIEERRLCDCGSEAGSADDHRADNDEQVFALV